MSLDSLFPADETSRASAPFSRLSTTTRQSAGHRGDVWKVRRKTERRSVVAVDSKRFFFVVSSDFLLSTPTNFPPSPPQSCPLALASSTACFAKAPMYLSKGSSTRGRRKRKSQFRSDDRGGVEKTYTQT